VVRVHFRALDAARDGAFHPVVKKVPYKHLAHVASFTATPIVFFSATTFHRRRLLDNQAAHEALRGVWVRSADANGWFVGRYILMPDHVHFFARPVREATRMQDWVKLWKSVSSRQICAALKVEPPLWQEEYFDRYLRTAESYGEKWNYVLQNAVKAGLAGDPADWPFQGEIHLLQFG
jgi:putative transposase